MDRDCQTTREEATTGIADAKLLTSRSGDPSGPENISDATSLRVLKVGLKLGLLVFIASKSCVPLLPSLPCLLWVFVVEINPDAQDARCLLYGITEGQPIALLDILDRVTALTTDVTKTKAFLVANSQ
jgi:hypothetical protein